MNIYLIRDTLWPMFGWKYGLLDTWLMKKISRPKNVTFAMSPPLLFVFGHHKACAEIHKALLANLKSIQFGLTRKASDLLINTSLTHEGPRCSALLTYFLISSFWEPICLWRLWEWRHKSCLSVTFCIFYSYCLPFKYWIKYKIYFKNTCRHVVSTKPKMSTSGCSN